MKILKIVLLVIGCIILLLVIVFVIYLLMNRQGVIESSEIGAPELEHKVLIASQGSDFKSALVHDLSKVITKDYQVYLKIIDVTMLGEVNEADWDAVILIHTTEIGKLQTDAKAYLERAHDLDKVILIITSGQGDWKTDDYDVDIITSASKQDELPGLTEDVVKRLDIMLSD
ncbi:MAG: hypothetical protein WBB37_06095 [bacterium]